MLFTKFKTALLGATLMGALAQPSFADVNAGAYLAARSAGLSNDFSAGVTYFDTALAADPTNGRLLNAGLVAHIGVGDFEQALGIAETMKLLGVANQSSNLVLATNAFMSRDFGAYFDGLAAGQTISPLVDGLGQGWAFVGLGEMTPALDAFDEAAKGPGMRPVGMYHKGLALASVGDFEGALEVFASTRQLGLNQSRRSIMAHAQILSQLDRNEDALALMDQFFGPRLDPALASLRLRLMAGEPVEFDLIAAPKDGMAEAIFTLAQVVKNDISETYTLLYARMVEELNPRHIQGLLLSGEMLTQLEQYDLANAVFARIPPSSPHFLAAEIDRANALLRAKRVDAATEVLSQLSRSHTEQPAVWLSLGTALAIGDKHSEAEAAYSRSIEIFARTNTPVWTAHFRRGTVRYELGDWEGTQADMRQALALSPNQAQVLNFLGYSYVERDENLTEALEMIEKAVVISPESGAIIDSLGWAYFQLDRYQDALEPMERATEILPTDPTINDHLGDVYWAVGRIVEAHFQWQRALSFDPAEKVAARIRLKLEIGLDEVLKSEGATPLVSLDDDHN